MHDGATIAVAVLVIVAATGGLWYAIWLAGKRRTREMRSAGSAMGFRWVEDADVPDVSLPLFERGHSRHASNVLEGEFSGRRVTLFDYTFVTGGGKSSKTHRQTVALLPDGAPGLPAFTLAPENLFHRIGQVFGYRDIDFEQDRDFSRAFLLRGEDERAVREAFHPTARSCLTSRPGWSIEAKQGTVALFKANRRCRPEGLFEFLREAFQILDALAPRR
jgi:hypothetical protein